jgi:hypothetical protein
MAKKFQNFLVEDMSKNVVHGGHKHELRIAFTDDLSAEMIKKGFHDYMLRMAAEKYKRISGQKDDYRTSVEDRQMAKEIHDTGVWKTTDRFILGTLRTSVVVEKVKMTAQETVAVMTIEELKAAVALAEQVALEGNTNEDSAEDTNEDSDDMSIAAG